eukprot:5436161-Prymnesium_polylepis.1
MSVLGSNDTHRCTHERRGKMLQPGDEVEPEAALIGRFPQGSPFMLEGTLFLGARGEDLVKAASARLDPVSSGWASAS